MNQPEFQHSWRPKIPRQVNVLLFKPVVKGAHTHMPILIVESRNRFIQCSG
jgi:hypothetical protein